MPGVALRPTRCVRIAAICAAALAASAFVVEADDVNGFPRVRSSHPYIRAMIDEARHRSATFGRLVDTIEKTNGIVYVEHGMCGHSVHACLLPTVTAAAKYRILRVIVDARQPDWDVMSSIAHELQHAIEVLTGSTVASPEAVFMLYSREAATSGDVFETAIAIRAGDAVRSDVDAFARKK